LAGLRRGLWPYRPNGMRSAPRRARPGWWSLQRN